MSRKDATSDADGDKDMSCTKYVGGPIIPEKLTFFLSGSYANNQVRPPDAPDEDLFYEKLKRGGFQSRKSSSTVNITP